MTDETTAVTRRRSVLATIAAGLAAGCTGRSADRATTTGDDAGVAVERVADSLTAPWSVTPLPGGEQLLVTERPGRLSLVSLPEGEQTTVSGVPSVHARGQGGLLDSELHPEFEETPWVYLTYASANGGESTTALGRGRLNVDSGSLEAFERLHVAEPFVESNGHFGSRVAFGRDGTVYQTVGDRQFKDFGPDHVAQDLTTELGVTLRLEPDGSIPDDNPFVDESAAADAIYSYGHRNAQGMAVHPDTGAIWQSEFGEQDGDEINVLRRGGNYGWPVADEGCTYGSGDPIGVAHADRDDVVGPVYSWPCGSGGFPPSGMTFYTGAAFPDWDGDLFVGGLASQSLARFTVDGTDVTEAEQLLSGRGWRIRDVAQGVDEGHLYVAVDAEAAPIVRLSPV
ncbi:PQQ-dependent sugar dehydrogenase [Halomicrobium mukohataei]|uniref:PQQ-dependent sugar dehydrogenase n=1 Tax=Halomicrobium mukohataei TaxID=57705 RepID=A0A847UGE5_9EURY|nr:PQQ-dependent sugar dehydrogenase [Halomicrobium mukohataei]NLV10640.1 PQQ-dependent sugar dehydrogenase [Halomicrobium mukohataei]